jgi:hypothetical protein
MTLADLRADGTPPPSPRLAAASAGRWRDISVGVTTPTADMGSGATTADQGATSSVAGAPVITASPFTFCSGNGAADAVSALNERGSAAGFSAGSRALSTPLSGARLQAATARTIPTALI